MRLHSSNPRQKIISLLTRAQNGLSSWCPISVNPTCLVFHSCHTFGSENRHVRQCNYPPVVQRNKTPVEFPSMQSDNYLLWNFIRRQNVPCLDVIISLWILLSFLDAVPKTDLSNTTIIYKWEGGSNPSAVLLFSTKSYLRVHWNVEGTASKVVYHMKS